MTATFARRCGVRGLLAAALLAASLLGSGCRERGAEVDVQGELTVYELGRVGGRIYNEPERVEEILDEVDMTPLEFEQRVRSITNSPEQSSEYTRGFEEVARPAPRAPGAPADTVPTLPNSAPAPDTLRPPG